MRGTRSQTIVEKKPVQKAVSKSPTKEIKKAVTMRDKVPAKIQEAIKPKLT